MTAYACACRHCPGAKGPGGTQQPGGRNARGHEANGLKSPEARQGARRPYLVLRPRGLAKCTGRPRGLMCYRPGGRLFYWDCWGPRSDWLGTLGPGAPRKHSGRLWSGDASTDRSAQHDHQKGRDGDRNTKGRAKKKGRAVPTPGRREPRTRGRMLEPTMAPEAVGTMHY